MPLVIDWALVNVNFTIADERGEALGKYVKTIGRSECSEGLAH